MLQLICKGVGSLCVLAAAATFGETRARTLASRVRQLEQFERSLKLLSAEITYSRALLPHAFQAVARRLDSPLCELYGGAAAALLAGDERSAREIWGGAAANIYPQSDFTAEDLEIVSGLGLSLGVSEQEGQQADRADPEAYRTGPGYSAGAAAAQREDVALPGLCRGAALVILLL